MNMVDNSRTPRGVRGLKFKAAPAAWKALTSHPSRGAWIEITDYLLGVTDELVAPLAGCVD